VVRKPDILNLCLLSRGINGFVCIVSFSFEMYTLRCAQQMYSVGRPMLPRSTYESVNKMKEECETTIKKNECYVDAFMALLNYVAFFGDRYQCHSKCEGTRFFNDTLQVYKKNQCEFDFHSGCGCFAALAELLQEFEQTQDLKKLVASSIRIVQDAYSRGYQIEAVAIYEYIQNHLRKLTITVNGPGEDELDSFPC
jgi:hypothetical protein